MVLVASDTNNTGYPSVSPNYIMCYCWVMIIKLHGVFQGAGHNDVELFNQYLERLKRFVSVELLN